MPTSRELLQHILDQINFLTRHAQTLSKEEYLQDEVMRLAFERSIEIIGEAVGKLPEDLRETYPQVEWQKIKAMRNLLVHVYWGVNHEVVWDVVTHHIHVLKADIQMMLADSL